MTDRVLSARGVRAFASAITRHLSPRPVVRKLWRAYWDYQARRTIAVLLYVLDEGRLAGIAVGPDRSESINAAVRLNLPVQNDH